VNRCIIYVNVSVPNYRNFPLTMATFLSEYINTRSSDMFYWLGFNNNSGELHSDCSWYSSNGRRLARLSSYMRFARGCHGNWDVVSPLFCCCSSRSYCTVKLQLHCHVEFEILTAVTMKSSVCWDIALCSLIKVCTRFWWTCRFLACVSWWFLAWHTLTPSRWRWYVPSEHRATLRYLSSVFESFHATQHKSE
jgi:hypothetical protein